MQWEDCVKRYVTDFYLNEDKRMLTQNSNGWKQLSWMCDLKGC